LSRMKGERVVRAADGSALSAGFTAGLVDIDFFAETPRVTGEGTPPAEPSASPYRAAG
jgi:hypothetical protein